MSVWLLACGLPNSTHSKLPFVIGKTKQFCLFLFFVEESLVETATKLADADQKDAASDRRGKKKTKKERRADQKKNILRKQMKQ